MEPKISEIADRIRTLREIMDFSQSEMATAAGVSLEEYILLENGGSSDYSFTFLYRCAEKFGVDIIELLTGENPHLGEYAVVRQGNGLLIKRREQFEYHHLAPNFKNKTAEPFIVRAPYRKEEQDKPLILHGHEGQEFDYIISGTLKFGHGTHEEILNAGDSVYYNAGVEHGMIATGGRECVFLAIVMKDPLKEQA
ncbi:MAG: cupin domain-containing protein [Candidatus Cloacimonetes bacterium]|jgi:transcriptional regulator with XRE-family HTH domain|nr:cupin domain-containing protein [Candidatus Cloacimonadota bacterium]